MTDTYGFVFQKVLHPTWERRIRHRPTLDYRSLLERTQWWSLDELLDFQSAELRKLLRHCWEHVPWYRRELEKIGLHPDDVRSVEDLVKLPLLTREDARASLLERRSTSAPKAEISKMTSGTTGRPLEFGYDWGSEHWRQAVKLRGYGWAGYEPGDTSVHYWGDLSVLHHQPLSKRVKVALDHAIKREHFFDCTLRSEEALERVVRAIAEIEPKVLVCYSQAGAALARHVLETRSEVPQGISVICAAERLFPADREVLVRAFGPNVFETYGSREVMLMAAECAAHTGMHISMENLILELVVREGDRQRPAEPGEQGEVVVTDLHNYGMPFVRYLTGDLASALPKGRCACGRALSRLAAIDGRLTDTLRDAAGRPVSGLFFIVMFSVMADKVRQFQAVQHTDGSIRLDLVAASGFDDGVIGLVEDNCTKFLPGVPLEIRVVPAIEVEPSGKLRVVKVETGDA